MPRTTYLILRKTPFQESSLIVAGISPDYGRLDFLLKGARAIGAKKFPTAELFRELNIEFKESKSRTGLFSMHAHEPLAQHDGIAGTLDTYMAACDYASFLLRHSLPMLAAPDAFASFRAMLTRMEQTGRAEPWRTLAMLSFLNEAGFLPENQSFDDVSYLENDTRAELLESLLEYANDRPGSAMPDLSPRYLNQLSAWTRLLCKYHSL